MILALEVEDIFMLTHRMPPTNRIGMDSPVKLTRLWAAGPVAEVADQTAHEQYFLGRFDYRFSAKDAIFARYLFDKHARH